MVYYYTPPPNGRKVYIEVYICPIFRKNSWFMEVISWMVTFEQSQYQYKSAKIAQTITQQLIIQMFFE